MRNGHAGAVIWLTGLSASGKSTLAMAVERRLFARGCFVYVLDGDNVRAGINKDLGFSAEDRAENIRRVAEVAALFADAGAIVVTAFISPFRKDRDAARAAAGSAFHEIYVSADLATCEARDPKGLYRRARSGEVKEFTGVTAPYEPPRIARARRRYLETFDRGMRRAALRVRLLGRRATQSSRSASYPFRKLRSTNATLAGRSAKRRMKYGYHSRPNGAAMRTV